MPFEDATYLPPATSPRTTTIAPAGELTLAPGAVIAGRYKIVRPLGRGAMGAVYQADDIRLGQTVALKFLPPALAADPRRLAQFHAEVSVTRQISHPNVCRVYDIGEVDGHLFLSMEYIDGEDLAAAIRRRGTFPERETIELARQICAGLAAVHARGILHRDLKPANIMINRAGQAQLMDFGIASTSADDAKAQIREGTPAYMAPEQLSGNAVTFQSDIYALGLVMHEMLTGPRVSNARTLDDLVAERHAAVSQAAAALRDVTPDLRDAMLQCLDPDPARRPQTAQAVAAMLKITLLDARVVGRRLFQLLAQMVVPVGVVVGLSLLRRRLGMTPTGLAIIGVAMVLLIVELRFPLHWIIDYKGHRIRFQNHAVFGERLYIDGKLADRGRVGLRCTLRGTIESGAGAGERITARTHAGFTQLSCRVVAESFIADAAMTA